MTLSAELILAAVSIILGILSAREYLTNGQRITPKLKAWLRVILIFVVVIIFLAVIKQGG